MSFDQKTRNLLQRTVSACRKILDEEFAAQRRETYGINDDGSAAPLETLAHLPDEDMQVARLLRDRLQHLTAGLTAHGKKEAEARRESVARLTREQAFTVLNRLAALRMAEEREIVLECVRQGMASEGFLLFQQTAGSALGNTFETYRSYLFLLFDELTSDLGVLFDRWDPAALMFPSKDALEAVLMELDGIGTANKNAEFDPKEFSAIWAQDEAIGWIYQYYNDETERKKMREESSAPRNSRELAVRNQFFTPRYVVEFLTDNTLGRLWYEMTKGSTCLKDQCRYLVRRPNEIFLAEGESSPEVPSDQSSVIGEESLTQEDLFKKPVFIPRRPLKDPREIRLLDPACGSMHFGLYAFDLFTVIYDEAWEIAHGPDASAKSAETFAPFVTFAASFADKTAFLREVPRLIVEHNIHGIDIDPRAAQIAGLSLWLRAQRAWHQAGIAPADRPRITRSNLVCAEPMPGEKKLLREFVESAFPTGERPAFAFLLETIFDCMTLAGEAGSLLRIEEEIRTAIADAKRLWKQGPKVEQALMFAEPGEKAGQGEMRLDLSGITDEQFWERAEQRIYDALEAYAEQAENGGGFQRRLFADDAAQGFAFIDLCRKRYDVVVMNPPFGSMPTNPRLGASMPAESGGNLYAAFVLRSIGLLQDGGTVGCISDRTFLLLPTYQEYRDRLRMVGLTGAADLDWGVLDGAQVATCAYIVGGQQVNSSADIWFIDAREASDKAEVVLSACSTGNRLVRISDHVFETIPTHPLAHWAPPSIRGAFQAHSGFEPTFGIVRKGLSPGDSDRFVKVWWEIPQHEFMLGKRWAPYANGGSFSPFYRAAKEVVDWRKNGEAIRSYCFPDGRPRYVIRSAELYGTPGLTFGKRGETLNVQLLPAGQVLSNEGYLILPSDGEASAWLFLAFFNSVVARYLVNMVCGLHKEVGAVKVVPIAKEVVSRYPKELIEHATRAFDAARELKIEETNPEYLPRRVLAAEFATLKDLATRCSTRSFNLKTVIQDEEKNINRIIGNAFGLGVEDSRTLEADLKLPEEHRSSEADSEPEDEAGDADRLPAELLSFSLGSVFGRWDIRYATGERPAPELPDPFAPLPVCPPGMLQGDDGLPLSPEAGRRLRAEGRYPLDVAWDGILVDDPNHALDLERNISNALSVLWGDRATALTSEACELLGVPSLREWFRRPAGFFADHLKRYSKSRRQAPIYWPLSTASGSYTLWIYYHRLTPDTLFKCIELVQKKIEDDVEPAILRLRTMLATEEGGTKERKQLAEAETLLNDLREFHADLTHWAPRWKPNLNDGVQITASPLWKLFRLPKWQKTLKETWQELEKGDYDWAHLALTLWPDRVREKCKRDRSLAIAHNLEELCEIQAPVPKKKAAKKATKKKTEENNQPELIEED